MSDPQPDSEGAAKKPGDDVKKAFGNFLNTTKEQAKALNEKHQIGEKTANVAKAVGDGTKKAVTKVGDGAKNIDAKFDVSGKTKAAASSVVSNTKSLFTKLKKTEDEKKPVDEQI
jgi:hypothetical protein